MSAVPPRENRIDLTVKAIKNDILLGDISGYLPGERELARRFRVGRVTVNGALQILEKQEWIEPSQVGKRRRILKAENAAAMQQSESDGSLEGKTVVVLAQNALDHMSIYERLIHMRMVTYCSNAGITLRHRELDLSRFKRPGHRLKEFLMANPADLYLLKLVSKEVQMWFDKNNVPALLLGSAWPLCKLPSIDLDQRAVGVHAASMLERMNHKNVGLLNPIPEKQGMRLFKEGFESVAVNSNLVVANVEDSVDSVRKGLYSLVRRAEGRPSVLLLPRIPHVMAAITYLPSIGLNIPHDISLLGLIYDEEFEFFHPQIAGYHCSVDTHVKKILEMVTRSLRHPDSSYQESELLTPDFIKAASLSALT